MKVKSTLQNFFWTWTALFSSSNSVIFLPKCCLSVSASDAPKSFISDWTITSICKLGGEKLESAKGEFLTFLA